MSQTCSALAVVLFDARALARARDETTAIVSSGVMCGAILNAENVAEVVDESGAGDMVQFWFGADGTWPFEKVVDFTLVEPVRILFVSEDADAQTLAEAAGLRVYSPALTESLAALLP